MKTTNEKAIIISGGPGMGKTAIIQQLSNTGFVCISESGRAIIQHQLATKGNKLPWADREAFALEMFEAAIRDFQDVLKADSYTFFDRGLPDVIGYLRLCKLPVPGEMTLAANQYRYHQQVFITPPWKEIYQKDKERKQSFDEAVATYEAMLQVYADLGYRIVEIPKGPVEARANFVQKVLADNSSL